MNPNYSFEAAVSECEFVAKTRNHTLGKWHRVTEFVYIARCGDCSEVAWIMRSQDEKRWQIGGTVLEQDCSDKD